MQAGAAGELAARVGEEPGLPGTGTREAGAWRWPCGRGQALRKRESSLLCRDSCSCLGQCVPGGKWWRCSKGAAGRSWCEGASRLGTELYGCVGNTEGQSSEGKWKTGVKSKFSLVSVPLASPPESCLPVLSAASQHGPFWPLGPVSLLPGGMGGIAQGWLLSSHPKARWALGGCWGRAMTP